MEHEQIDQFLRKMEKYAEDLEKDQQQGKRLCTCDENTRQPECPVHGWVKKKE